MKRVFNYSYILFLIIILACDKDVIEIKNIIPVGISDSEFKITDIDPYTVLTSWEIKTNYSIDLNADDSYDITLSVLNQYMFGGMSLLNSELRI